MFEKNHPKITLIFLSLVPFLISGLELNKSTITTPFCDLCPCNSQPNNPPNVNCDHIPLEIGSLYNKSLWIDNHNQSHQISTLSYQFHQLKILENQFPSSDLIALNLGNNEIRVIRSAVFTNLQKLETLILSHNEIERIDPDVFRGEYVEDRYFPLTALKTLDLSYNNIHTLDSDVFEHIDELETLSLNHNPLKVIDAQTTAAIASLVYLNALDLSYAQLKDLPADFMYTPKFLKVLDLSGNDINGIPTTLGESRSLEVLKLDGNPIRNLTSYNGFPLIPTLKILHLSQMPLLEKIGAFSLGGLGNLEELLAEHNGKLVEIHKEAMKITKKSENRSLQELKKLVLRNNSISYLDRSMLSHWDGLQILDLSENPWTCDCENQWMIEELVPIYLTIGNVEKLTCQNPIEMQNVTFYSLYKKQSHMRCLDYYGNRPEKDALLLIGTLSGLLALLVMLTIIVYIYRSRRFHYGIFSGFATGRPYYSRM